MSHHGMMMMSLRAWLPWNDDDELGAMCHTIWNNDDVELGAMVCDSD